VLNSEKNKRAQYRVRVVYSYQGWGAYPLQSLWAVGADGAAAFLHPDQVNTAPSPLLLLPMRSRARLQPAPQPLGPQEWDVPKQTTAAGGVSIRCVQAASNGGGARGCLISEVHAMQQQSAASARCLRTCCKTRCWCVASLRGLIFFVQIWLFPVVAL